MPELPEVETMRRGILDAIGATILGIHRPKTNYRPLAMSHPWSRLRQLLVGTTIVDVRRIGKRVLVDLDSNHSLIFQPKMSGLLVVGEPPTKQHVRMRVELGKGSLSQFTYWDSRGLGAIQLWSPEEVEANLGPAQLGPDAIAVEFDPFVSRIKECKREIKPTLLDQKRIAGIGNLYASEILHRAKIHPKARCDQLLGKEWRRIYRAMREILLAAIEYEGSTLGDGTYRNSKSDPGSYQNHHLVYARDGEICPSCDRATIRRIVQAQRSTFYCEVCQVLSSKS